MRRIGLIAHGGTTTGNQRYMIELSRALLQRDDGFGYTIFYTREEVRRLLDTSNIGVRFWKVWPESSWLRHTISLPLAVALSGVDIIHSQYGLPAMIGTKGILMLHDAYFARHPEHHPLIQRLQLAYRVPRAIRAARRVIVPSEFTRDDLLHLYHIDEGKMRVVPHGVAPRFRPAHRRERDVVRAKYGLPETFILFVGALQPRKNLVRLVEAFGMLDPQLRRSNPLIISGAARWMYQDLNAVAAPFLAEGTVRFLGFADDEDLPALMSLSTLFAFPSLSEGFGFPAVEAMRCGACVLAANAGSLPEIVRDGGLLVDPWDVDAIRAGLQRLLHDPVLRGQLATRGQELAAAYTWEKTAKATVQIYDEVIRETDDSAAGSWKTATGGIRG